MLTSKCKDMENVKSDPSLLIASGTLQRLSSVLVVFPLGPVPRLQAGTIHHLRAAPQIMEQALSRRETPSNSSPSLFHESSLLTYRTSLE